MQNIDNLENILIITEMDYYPIVYSFKNAHPNLNIKIISKNDVLDKISFSFSKDPIPYLIHHGYEYSRARKLMQILRTGNISQNEILKIVFNNLKSEGFITYDQYGLRELKGKKIFILELQEDRELKSLLQRNDLSFEDLSFEDLDIPSNDILTKNKIYYFANKFSQYMYIFSDIRRRIVENEEEKNHIKILIKDASDVFYVKLFSSLFDIRTYIKPNLPLISNNYIKEKIKNIYRMKSFDFSDEELEIEELIFLNDLIKKYDLFSLPFNEGYSNLLEIINSYSFKEEKEEKGILVTDRYNFDKNAIIYVTNFAYGDFYNVFADNNILSDASLDEIDVNTSYIKTSLDRRKKLNYLRQHNIVLLSRVEQHLTDKIYDSQFIQEFHLKNNIIRPKFDDYQGLFTDKALKLYSADVLDKNYVTEQVGDINSYSHQFKGLKDDKGLFTSKDRWHVTKLESYSSCPFKFLLDYLIDYQSGDYTSRARGNLIHSVFETFHHDDFDVDKALAKGLEEYKQAYLQNNAVYGPKEEAYAEIISYWLRKYIEVFKEVRDISQFDNKRKNDSEQTIYWSLYDEEGKEYKFSGRIDKLLITQNEGRNYFTIIDYKTGMETFNPYELFLGKSTQLPLYTYALLNNDKQRKALVGESEFGGFGIQHVYFSSFKKAFVNKKGVISKKELKSKGRLEGVALNSKDYWLSIDETGYNHDKDSLSQYGGTFVTKKILFSSLESEENVLAKNRSNLKKYNLQSLLDDAVEGAINTIKKIRNLEFDVAPSSLDLTKFKSDNLACKYCPYKNVCYRKSADAVNYSDEIDHHFFNEEDK